MAEHSQGYTYLLSRAGVTGSDAKAGMPVENMLNTLHQYNAPPPLLGFGISTPQQVKEAITSGAAGAISGSAVVKIIANNLQHQNKLLSEMHTFIKEMKAATFN